MQKVIPTFRITNYEKSKSFYIDGLGFSIDWEHRFEPDFPVYMQITRDGLSLSLSEHTGDCQAGGLVNLFVENVDDWYNDFQSRGVSVKERPNESIQGLRGMTVIDPDGNKIRIFTRLSS
jgi:catechol 2,3-dioxygenase-like lactoylglutathione lyase family enzyme